MNPTRPPLDPILSALGIESSPEDARDALRAWLTERPAAAIPPGVWPLLDELWDSESRERTPVPWQTIPTLANSGVGARMRLWRGDITTLAIDAIVNAANRGLTGCYMPFHRCVDNAIHTAAGPRLRQECEGIMAARGRPEPTATATLTRGYYLAARHVVHTVGPIVEGGRPSAEDRARLARCYRECLQATADAGARSLGVCGISTGVFGYPPAEAAPVALQAVREALLEDPRIEGVVFVTFSSSDRAAYEAALQEP